MSLAYLTVPNNIFTIPSVGEYIAHAGGGSTYATPLTTNICNIQTVASNLDSVILTKAGMYMIINSAYPGNSHLVNIYPPAGASFVNANGGADQSSIGLGGGTSGGYMCIIIPLVPNVFFYSILTA